MNYRAMEIIATVGLIKCSFTAGACAFTFVELAIKLYKERKRDKHLRALRINTAHRSKSWAKAGY